MAPVAAPTVPADQDPRLTAFALGRSLGEANGRLRQSRAWYDARRRDYGGGR